MQAMQVVAKNSQISTPLLQFPRYGISLLNITGTILGSSQNFDMSVAGGSGTDQKKSDTNGTDTFALSICKKRVVEDGHTEFEHRISELIKKRRRIDSGKLL
ncbi:hypothetical protein niasHT_025453 [Heterodera trifolii]|uniref:Uncharacterized protein n=1 Tax=Heterodera trifolii TaxID=157864 RepID=A0ABD2JWY7_9BILA